MDLPVPEPRNWVSMNSERRYPVTNNGDDRTPYLEADLQFTAYCITTTISMAGNCITQTDSPVYLINGYIVPILFDVSAPGQTKSASVQTIPESMIAAQESSEFIANLSAFLKSPYSSFYDVLGYKGFAATLPPSQTRLKFIGRERGYSAKVPGHKSGQSRSAVSRDLCKKSPEAIAYSAGIRKDSSSECPGSVQRAEYTRTVIISVVVPNIALMILLSLIVIRIYRDKRGQAASTKPQETTSDMQPDVDQKAELEDEGRRRHELDGSKVIYEMEGEDRRFEMPGNGDTGVRSARSDRIQELRCAEHSKELEIPNNIEIPVVAQGEHV